MPADRPEVEAIEAAYQDQIKLLFKVLLNAVTTREPDKQAMARFKTGLDLARRAREMALAALDTGPTTETPRGVARPRRGGAKRK